VLTNQVINSFFNDIILYFPIGKIILIIKRRRVMKKISLLTLLTGLALFISSNYIYSQASNDTVHFTGTAGKIYTKAAVDSLYGPVLNSDTIKTADLANLAVNSPSYIMFNLINGKACILNASRQVIFSTAQTINPDQQFRLFSTNQVLELIKQGGSDVTSVEKRANTITLTNGVIAMEEGEPCPPICP
jgi:hypothetical protein